jgi:hypothetical protein
LTFKTTSQQAIALIKSGDYDSRPAELQKPVSFKRVLF